MIFEIKFFDCKKFLHSPTVPALRQAQCKLSHEHFKSLDSYMLLCNQKTFYIGITDNFVNRYSQHKNKQSFYTKQFSDIEFVYAEKYDSKHKAALREKQLKGWSNAKKQLLINGKLGINTCTEFIEELVARSEELW